MQLTNIGWCGGTYNIAKGCTHVNSLCDNCYMFRDVERWGGNPTEVIRTKPATFNKPLYNKVPTVYFLASMTDFFHAAIDSYRAEVWDIIARTPHHIYQILTKRPGRIARCLPADWESNPEKWAHVWLGTSIGGDKADVIMVEKLVQIPASVLFLSIEPLIASVQDALLNFIAAETNAMKWCIVGGESGNGKVANDTVKYGYRESELEWFTEVVNACNYLQVPCFVKQLGVHLAKELGASTRTGKLLTDLPECIRVRQFPIDVSKYICNSNL